MRSQDFKYRKLINAKGLVRSAVIEKDSDMLVFAEKALTTAAHEVLDRTKKELEEYISKNPKFEKTFKPHNVSLLAPKVIRTMAWAAKRAVHFDSLESADPERLAVVDPLLHGKRLFYLGEADHFVDQVFGFRRLWLRYLTRRGVRWVGEELGTCDGWR